MLQIKIALSLLLILFFWGRLYADPAQTPLLSDLDIPLMQGFQEEDGSRVVFDTPEGRIIEVRASGPHNMAMVVDYYNVVLPSLSWMGMTEKAQNCNGASTACIMARRGGEILTLKITEIKQPTQKTIIYFSVNPE